MSFVYVQLVVIRNRLNEVMLLEGIAAYNSIIMNIRLKDVKEPKKVEMALWKIVPPQEGSDLCHRFVIHGREVCTARTRPYCDKCCLNDICKKNGI